MFTFKIQYQAPEKWDEQLLKGNTESLHLFHSTSWARRLEKLLKYKPVYFTVNEGETLRLMLLGFIQPSAKFFSIENIKVSLHNPLTFTTRRRNFIWNGQPICMVNSDKELYCYFAKVIDQFLIEQSLVLQYGEWPIIHENALPEKWNKKIWATLKVDLAIELDEIFASFKSSARKEIKKAERNGIVIKKISNLSELEEYYAFAVKCAKRYHKSMFGFEDFQTMWIFFRNWGHFETFVAYESGQMAGGLSVWGDKFKLIEIGSFQSEESFQKKNGSSDAIKWEAIRWGKSINAKSFDLAGINPFPSNEKELGIKRFKEKWTDSETKYLVLNH